MDPGLAPRARGPFYRLHYDRQYHDRRTSEAIEILIVGAGVIGIVYGAQLSAAGNAVSVLAHGARTEAIPTAGLRAYDVIDRTEACSPAGVISTASEGTFDVVLVALRWDHVHGAAIALSAVNGHPLVVFLGNNLAGRSGLPEIPGAEVRLGFPGVGGTMAGDVANYVKIAQQPTALEAMDDPRLTELAAALRSRGFEVQRVSQMNGWLAYHDESSSPVSRQRCTTAAQTHSGLRTTTRSSS